jgi:LmbE family N-acetylglucosaminyl deacetylase
MRVLAIGAHPDDIEINCVGTLIKCKKRGDEVFACHMSDGDMGHVTIMPKELGEIRRKEAQTSGALAGISVIWGGSHDLDIYDEKGARDRLVKIIRDVRPDVIITHGQDDYMPDHTAVAKLVFDASFSASCPHYLPELGDATPVCPIYLMNNASGINFIPDLYVDITEEMELKQKMFACHESQIVWLRDHDNVDYVEQVEILARFYGLQCGVKYAECFRECLASGRQRASRLLP